MGFPTASAFALLWFTSQVIAASCTQSDWEWSHNSLGQDPCAVVQVLQAKCKNLTSFELQPLRAGTDYVTPQKGTATGCSCNTVTYSLYQACSKCQIPKSGNTWTFYEMFCDVVYVTQIPLDIPSDTQVPPWAYLDVTKENNFNLTAARALVDNRTILDSPPSLAMSSDTKDPTPTATNHTGVIIGSVVGGIAAIALSIALVLIFFTRRRPANRSTTRLEREPPQVEESLLSPGPHSPPIITRDLPRNATYRELSRSGVLTAYDSSFYPKNMVAPSQNGYHGFAEV
ncbi:hypothetical protein BJ322DRAFT_600194 [Thelephora terrestris]|uniref:Transmembrane protein n=1 Tax=Thelephora terrestris TaxID=56493 RepID=A0A9P6HJ00_9AGAM|nr:hypothetical protein BJ322DRAFT_600194 [Thelephora terrestris]